MVIWDSPQNGLEAIILLEHMTTKLVEKKRHLGPFINYVQSRGQSLSILCSVKKRVWVFYKMGNNS